MADQRSNLIVIRLSPPENPHAILPEYAVSHTIHLLAHHPEFSRTDPQALDTFKECVEPAPLLVLLTLSPPVTIILFHKHMRIYMGSLI